MRHCLIRLLALLLCVTLLCTGCSFPDPSGNRSFSEMTYTRPDIEQLQATLENSCIAVASASNFLQVETAVWQFYDVYDDFYTNLSLADIHYCQDMTDPYWEAEYNYCLTQSVTVDAGLETLYRALAQCPYRAELESDEYFGAGYFDYYEGDPLYDATFTSLMEQESALVSRYYDLLLEADNAQYYSNDYFTTYGSQMESLFVELVALRQKIAAYAGYGSYPEYAYDMYYYRDYTPAQAESYLTQIGIQLQDLYRQASGSGVWDEVSTFCSDADTLYYLEAAAENMGSTISGAFSAMREAEVYDITYSENKYDAAFTTYLTSYEMPFVFIRPYLDQTDKLVFAHEFGHFVNQYICYGNYAETDVAEVHSQAMEYLTLCYGEDTELLTRYKMADCLCTYVEQSMYALFEHQVYALDEDELTVENVHALYASLGEQFGFDSWDWDSRDYVLISHFFTDPMYIVSYVGSNDVALQLYQMELDSAGTGLALYQECLESTDSYLLNFAQYYGLEDPFDPGRLAQVQKTLEAALQ